MSDRIENTGTAGSVRRGGLWIWMKIALAVVLIGVLVAQIDVQDILVLWQRASPVWFLVSVGAYIVLTVASAWRYWWLIDRQVPFRQTLGLVVLQTVIGNFVASSAGLASYIALLRGRYQVRVSQAIGSVVIARLGDLMVLLVALALSAWAVWPQITPLRGLVAALLLALTGVIGMFIGAFVLRQRAVVAAKTIMRSTYLDRLDLARRMLASLEVVAARRPAELQPHILRVVGLSLLILAFQFAVSYAYTRMFDLSLSVGGVLFVFALGMLLSFLPIHVFGGLGVTDLTTLYLYQLLGLQADIAVSAVVSSRLFFVLLNLIILLYLPFEGGEAAVRPEGEPVVEVSILPDGPRISGGE